MNMIIDKNLVKYIFNLIEKVILFFILLIILVFMKLSKI